MATCGSPFSNRLAYAVFAYTVWWEQMSSFASESQYLAAENVSYTSVQLSHWCLSSNWQIASGSASYTASSLSRQLARIQWFMLSKGTSLLRIVPWRAQYHWSIVIRSRVPLPLEKLLMEVPRQFILHLFSFSCKKKERHNLVLNNRLEEKKKKAGVQYLNSSGLPLTTSLYGVYEESLAWSCQPWSQYVRIRQEPQGIRWIRREGHMEFGLQVSFQSANINIGCVWGTHSQSSAPPVSSFLLSYILLSTLLEHSITECCIYKKYKKTKKPHWFHSSKTSD